MQNEGGKPAKILEVQGSYFSFDAAGNAAEAFRREVREVTANLPILANLRLSDDWLGTDKSNTVVDIGPEVRRERFMREHRWELTKHDLDRIAADIWKKPMVAEKVKDAKGVASKTQKRRGGTRSRDETR